MENLVKNASLHYRDRLERIVLFDPLNALGRKLKKDNKGRPIDYYGLGLLTLLFFFENMLLRNKKTGTAELADFLQTLSQEEIDLKPEEFLDLAREIIGAFRPPDGKKTSRKFYNWETRQDEEILFSILKAGESDSEKNKQYYTLDEQGLELVFATKEFFSEFQLSINQLILRKQLEKGEFASALRQIDEMRINVESLRDRMNKIHSEIQRSIVSDQTYERYKNILEDINIRLKREHEEFEELKSFVKDTKEKIGYETAYEVYGESLRILVMKPENTIISQISQHMTVILFMIAVNILLPWILTYIINRSFTSRLSEISEAFDGVEAESLKEIENICGKDEIGGLMRNYNRMVIRSQELIKTVYKDRLERQEIDIARQNAELLALHSQINPHFLFNVLESIRMHSILKNEEETAGMIERLAVLERQNVDWSSDFVRIQEELQFIEAYLELQKYRFGDRLSYEISAEPDCRSYLLPKLTLVTFAENACVHGVERKASHCWIYIRAYRKEDWLYLEVEDTGNGMEEEEVAVLTQKMESCDIETVKENEHVGMINACLRLKMVTENRAEFELESERGVGTFMTIRVPLEMLDKGGMRT